MIKKVIIHSEQFYVAKEPTEILTVLGSCVSVCLYDYKNKIGGMNHYLLPFWNGNGLKSLKFGNINNERLLVEMKKKGAEVKYLKAKIFGGAAINISKEMSIGEKNAMVAREFLEKYRIPLLAEDIGGTGGRKVIFDTDSGDVYVKYSK
jgi:chemotaxis protein CheD